MAQRGSRFPVGLTGQPCAPLVRPHFPTGSPHHTPPHPVLRSLEIMLISKLRPRVPKCASGGTWNLKTRPTPAEGHRNHKMQHFLKNHKKRQNSAPKRDPEKGEKSMVEPSCLSCGILLALLMFRLSQFCLQVLLSLKKVPP